ncbi:ParB/RepB/Spo0J family partition protein [Bradyrhizobium sp. WSM2793]|uniref:ParB/RepB/Spo0J family partition protein n=1 Tax=Bradyrhizobium sp. WSM2793 TaxID=1038866 RepID=UPI0003A17C09|nr:ParB/RepB/Spo0J family partition protein [Bradyrhizobium sp. WSM2793]
MPLGKMSKEDSLEVSRWLKNVNFKNLHFGPKKKKKSKSPSRKPPKANHGPSAATEVLMILPISEIEVGHQLLAPDLAAIAELKASISLGGDVAPPIVVRKRRNGTYELLDGHTRLAALKEIGSTTISAIVWSNLGDWDAKFRRNAGQRGRVRTALDRALIDNELFELMKEKVSQDATPRGGRQPEEQYIRKAAKQLNLSKDRLIRSRKIAGIDSEVRQKIRELGLDDNQSVLLDVAGAGDAAKQMQTLELHRAKTETGSKPRQQGTRTRSSAAKNEFRSRSDYPERKLNPRSRKELGRADRDLSDTNGALGSNFERDPTNDKETKVLVRMKASDWDEIERQQAGARYTLSAICVRQKWCSLKITKIEKTSGDVDAPDVTDGNWDE